MATQIQFRRGTTSEHSSFTGAVGEVTVDTDKDTMVVHDNSQAGGYAMANLKTAQEFTATQNFNATTLTDASTISWDASANQVTSVTLGGNRTLGAASNQIDGGVYVISIIQDGTGSRTVTFNSNYKFVGGSAPTLTTDASARDVLVFVSNGTNMFEIGRALNVS
mgnify:CR=1 FL=1|tara:strand:+ start:18141 stop:18635 length:495 start_codon:yes stop_codon:yes gene_type:complete